MKTKQILAFLTLMGSITVARAQVVQTFAELSPGQQAYITKVWKSYQWATTNIVGFSSTNVVSVTNDVGQVTTTTNVVNPPFATRNAFYKSFVDEALASAIVQRKLEAVLWEKVARKETEANSAVAEKATQ